ncbi:hypothetical protein PF003_g4115 [Phytophthora fragariae]|nr:hypothetical protein PF003_g4118 [Phytophthora fragariae]KAE8911571.1 hypothetical protein PF003_g4115 [Phytophthora fragariae]
MRVRERRCRDKACKEVSAGKPCAWYCKTQECQKLHLMTVAERGEHLTPRRGVEPVRMTAAMKAFATDLAAQGLKPSRIRNGMMTRFSLDHETLPSLQVVQRFVNHYTRSRLRNNDFIDEATNDIWEAGFTVFLLNDAEITGEVVYVFQQASVRVYDPELKRTREALPVTAQLSYHTGRMELKEMPPTGWAVDVSTGRCPCLYNMKYAACVHSLIAMHDRAHTGERERFCYRGPGREAGQSAQAAERPMNNRQALDDERS